MVKSEIRVNESEELKSPTCLGEERWVKNKIRRDES